MKTWLSLLFIVAVGLGAAFYVGFSFLFTGQPVAEDKELEQVNDKYVIEFSHIVAKNTPKGLAASHFAEKVSEKTDGWVEVQIYPNGVRYTAQEEFDALRQNDVQMIAPAFSEITSHDPPWYLWDLPYLFDSEEMVHEAFDGNVGEMLFDSIAQRGFKGLAYWDNGFKQITTKNGFAIDPYDLMDQTFRVMPSEVLKETYETVGGEVVNYPFNEVYEKLESGEIDGTENTLSNIYSKGFFQSQEYLTITNHNYLGYAVLINPDFWESLPEEYRHAVIEAMDETTKWLRKHSQKLNEESLENLRDSNHIQIHEQTEKEKEAWQHVFMDLSKKYEEVIGEAIMNELK